MNRTVEVGTSVIVSKDEVVAILKNHLVLTGALTPGQADKVGLDITDEAFTFTHTVQTCSEVPIFKGKESN